MNPSLPLIPLIPMPPLPFLPPIAGSVATLGGDRMKAIVGGGVVAIVENRVIRSSRSLLLREDGVRRRKICIRFWLGYEGLS